MLELLQWCIHTIFNTALKSIFFPRNYPIILNSLHYQLENFCIIDWSEDMVSLSTHAGFVILMNLTAMCV